MMNTATTQSENTPSDSTKPAEAVTPRIREPRSESQWNPQRGLRDFPNAENIRAAVDKVAVLLLSGKRFSRRDLGKFGLRDNGSLHSFISDFEHRYDTPASRKRDRDSGVSDYWIQEDVLMLMRHPAGRKAVADGLRRQREQNMIKSGVIRFEGVLDRLEQYPELMELHPWVESVLRGIAKRISKLVGEGARNDEF